MWVDAADLTAEQIHAESSIDPARAGCEEFACMDTDGLPIDGEPSMDEATAWGELYDEVGDHMWPALCACVRSGSYAAQGGTDLPVVSAFEDGSAGEWESFEDYAAQLAEDCGTFDSVPEELRQYVDDGTALIHLPDYDDGDYLIEPDDVGLYHLYELGWCFLEARD